MVFTSQVSNHSTLPSPKAFIFFVIHIIIFINDLSIVVVIYKHIEITPSGPASRAGLRVGDKILQCNGYDFTIVTHKKAVEYIQRHDVLNLLVTRRDINQ